MESLPQNPEFSKNPVKMSPLFVQSFSLDMHSLDMHVNLV